MSASKRPSTSSLRRFITSRPYVPIAEIRRRFGLDDPDAMSRVGCNGTSAFVGLPDREASKIQDLWQRGEVGVELSVEVRAPVVVGVYPMRIARYVIDQQNGSGYSPQDVSQAGAHGGGWSGNGHPRGGGHRQSVGGRTERQETRPGEQQPAEQYAPE